MLINEYTRFRDREVVASGLLEGLDSRSPIRVSVNVKPWIRTYLIVNIDGRCIAYATITFHADNPHSTRKDERLDRRILVTFYLSQSLAMLTVDHIL